MEGSLYSLSGIKRSITNRVIPIVRNHTFPQIRNAAKYGIHEFRGFNSIYLRYYPLGLFVFITSRCNLSCKFCQFHSPDKPSNYLLEYDDMSLDVFKRIVDKFGHAVRVEFGGVGEPFLHSHIFEMVVYANEHRMRTKIFTNGIVTHDMLDKISRSPLSNLNISLNACDSDEFFELHGGSEQTYNTLLDDISKLVEIRNRYNEGLRITISYVCTKSNHKNIPKLVEMAEHLRVDGLIFFNLYSCGIPGFLRDQCLYDDDGDVIEIIKGLPSPKSHLEVVLPRLYKREYLQRRCSFPFHDLTIDAEGNIAPCCQIVPRRDYGNVFLDEDVWNNPALQSQREIFIDQTLPLPDFCKSCTNMVAEWSPAYVPHRRGIR